MKKQKYGLTLIEVIISSLILSITVGSILYLFSTQEVVVARTGRRVEAMNFARQTIEQLKNEVRNDTWLVGTLSAGTHTIASEAFLSLSGTELGDKFPGQGRTYTVTDIDADNTFNSDGIGGTNDDIDYKKVTVTVDWTEPSE